MWLWVYSWPEVCTRSAPSNIKSNYVPAQHPIALQFTKTLRGVLHEWNKKYPSHKNPYNTMCSLEESCVAILNLRFLHNDSLFTSCYSLERSFSKLIYGLVIMCIKVFFIKCAWYFRRRREACVESCLLWQIHVGGLCLFIHHSESARLIVEQRGIAGWEVMGAGEVLHLDRKSPKTFLKPLSLPPAFCVKRSKPRKP